MAFGVNGDPAEPADQAAPAVGDEVHESDFPVPLGRPDRSRERQGAVVPHPEGRLAVVVKLELARVGVDGRGQNVDLAADIDEQVRIEGVVDFVQQNPAVDHDLVKIAAAPEV